MPNGEFEKKLADWETKGKEFFSQLQQSEQLLGELGEQFELIQRTPPAHPGIQARLERERRAPEPYMRPPYKPDEPDFPFPFWTEDERRRAWEGTESQITSTLGSYERSLFYYRLYTGIPYTISSGHITSADEIFKLLPPPSGMTTEELAQIRDIAEDMISSVPPITGEPPEEPVELLPELEIPIAISGIPVNINQLTIEEILKALQTPAVPEPVMTDAEWRELMEMEGYTDADLEQVEFMRQQSEQLIQSWGETDTQLVQYRQALAEMPEYKATDWAKELVIQPGLALLEIVNLYFEKVTQPLAGLVYRTLIPDIETHFQKLRQSHSEWEALQLAWEEWDAPGDGAASWLLKYLLMESLVDPLTYVGWGIATRIAKPIPYIGRLVGAAERGAARVLDLPFDLIKATLGRVPKTLGQRALVAQHRAGQFVEKYVTKSTGKFLSQIKMDEFTQAINRSIRYTFRHPQVMDDIAIAGRELLKHSPVDETIVKRWATRLGITLSPEDITRTLIENVDNVFEDMFTKRVITSKEAGGQLLRILRVTPDAEGKLLQTAQRILGQHSSTITNNARALGRAKSPRLAMQALMRRNYRTHIRMEESVAARSRMEIGSFAAMLQDIPPRLQAIWSRGVDRTIIRPFAEAYLAFGMYGPMNVFEDYFRSVLGGVIPRRMNVEQWERLSWGLSVDPELKRYGLSEMLGPIAREGTEDTWNNWILQFGGLAKGWGNKIYTGLIRLPGAWGADIRRNFVGKRYIQLLKERGGDAFEQLMRVGPNPPRLVNRKLVKQLEAQVYRMKTTLNPDLIRGSKDLFTRKRIVRQEVRDILSEHPNLPNSARDHILKSYDDDLIFREGAESIQSTVRESNNLLMDDYLRGPEYAAKQMEDLADQLIQLEVVNPEEMSHAIQSLNKMSQMYGATPKQIIAQATIRSRGLPLAERRAGFDKVFDDLYGYLDRAGASIDRVVERLRLRMGEGITFSSQYTSKADALFDIMTTIRQKGAQFRAEDMAWRHDVFAGRARGELTPTFWDEFYLNVDQRYVVFNREMAELEGILASAIEQVDIAAGIKPFARASIRVTDRPLAPQDIAKLVGARGDDISRALLDVMTIQNDRDMFISYIMGKVRPGDEGFTRESIGTVYDQIMSGLQVRPETANWITAKQMELEAVRRDMHSLYNSKLLPDDEIEAIARYLDGTADAVEDMLYITPTTRTGYRAGRLQATVGEMATEGEGLYIGKTRELADLFRDRYFPGAEYTRSIKYMEPRRPLEIPSGELFALQESDILFEPIRAADSEWARIQKQAAKNVGLTPENYYPKQAAFHKEISNLTRAAGYDAVDAGDWYVLLDESLWRNIPKEPRPTLREEFRDFDRIRQESMDEAHKWYYKEYTDYTHANAFDAAMKAVYPYWTYESQRLLWLPRSFIRHPGTFTAFERWQDNSELGYIPIPGWSAEINPFRGTVYGVLTSRLVRRDYPEYYDALPLGDWVEFMDFLSRYGFYPGAHIGIPLAMFGGLEQQMGEVMPAIWKTPLNALIAAFPENEAVKTISNHIFSDRFRDYMTIIEITSRGYNGTQIWGKIKLDEELTDDEQAAWDDARREVAAYGVLFEQSGLFRLRTEEQRQVYKAASQLITEWTGYSEDQQEWLRRHGYRLWDMVGGMSPTQQAVLQEMDYYRWVGLTRPLLPSRQQVELNKLESDWDDVERYVEGSRDEVLQLQRDFLSGALGPDGYNDRLIEFYDDRRKYVDSKMEEDPLMSLEGRKEYYKRYNIAEPVLHPFRELLNLYFSIELEEKYDEETGERIRDWDTFWAQRQAIEDAIPDHLKEEWDDYISRNTTRIEELRRDVYDRYFRKYNQVWDGVLTTYPEDEQRLIEEYLHLERTGAQLDRQAEIKAMRSAKTDNLLISSFRSELSEARRALRYANPHLDAWLFYWGRVTTFLTPIADQVYYQLAKETGREVGIPDVR